jgi:hypothetical protein
MKITADQIPPEVVEAFEAATPGWHWLWNINPSIAEALAAALAAWPGTQIITEGEPGREHSEVVLPLPQEPRA